MTSPTWTPPPTMPADLPPLPMGRNGKPLVYVGMGMTFKRVDTDEETGLWALLEEDVEWNYGGWSGTAERHFAAECDSDICRLNQWGDFTPAQPSEPAKEPPKSAVERHLAQLRKEAEAAEKDFKDADKAYDAALALRSQKLAAMNDKLEVIYRLEGTDDALSRQKWMEHGMKIQRLHLKKPTVFPKFP